MNTKTNPHKSRFFTLLLALVLALAPAFSLSQPAQAEPIACVVTSATDSGDGTLRAWLADTSCSTITFGNDYEIHLTSPLVIETGRTVTIDGVGRTVIITDDSYWRVFTIRTGANATLQNLTITQSSANSLWDDYSPMQAYYSLIKNLGNLTVTGTTLTGINATDRDAVGGGIYNGGMLTVRGSTFTNISAASGGAIYNDGYDDKTVTANVENSTFSGNTSIQDAPGGLAYVYIAGGAIANFMGILTVTGSTFDANMALYAGGAISSIGPLTVTNSTFGNNSATTDGGAIFTYLGELTNNTFVGNSAANGAILFYNVGLPFTFHNNLMVKDSTGTNCAFEIGEGELGAMIGSNNMADDGSCVTTSFTGVTTISDLSTQLGALGNHGGYTHTIPLLAGSAAVDAGDDSQCPATDQRGVTRPQGAACDVGAYEYEPPITYSISGQVFEDLNGNGILDGSEVFTYFGDTVHLDQDCDGSVDASYRLTYYDQIYTFANLPAGQSYCVSYYNPGYRTTTPNPVTTSLSEDMTGVNIGFAYVWLELSVSPPIGAPVNEYFERTIAVTHGDAPYTFTAPVTEPAPGLTALYFSNGNISIYGTPTQPGEYSFVVDVTDNNGAHKQETVHLWVQLMPVFEFTSTPDPWAAGEPVTFTFGLVNPDHLAFAGQVTFYAGSEPIEECRGAYSDPAYDPYLYLYDLTAQGNEVVNPVTCTTTLASLENITATYTAMIGAFQSASATLEQISYNISGTVFNDINGNGSWDTDESGLEGASILLDIPCGSGSNISIPINFDGSYMLMGLPPDVCMSLSASHSPSYTNLAYRVTTPAVKFDPLSADQTGVNIGLLEYGLTYSPSFQDGLPAGQLNQPYSQPLTVIGGVAPYTFRTGSEGNLPINGLNVSTDDQTGVITISGTPTVAGEYTLDIYATDANGAEAEVQGMFFVKTAATFSLTSSANPVNYGQPVTFSLSATGTVDPYQPNGPVTFKADGVVIPGCDQLILGYDENGIYANPVTCTTSALTAGSHVITADFTSSWGPYNDATVTLAGGQVVVSTVAADLSITKTDSKDPVKPGAQLVYMLTVKNLGPNTAQTLTLVDTLDRNTTYVTVSAPKGWTCKYANYAVTCTSTSLASGSSAVIKITVTVNKTAKVGKELVNNATVSSLIYDPVLTNNSVVQKTMVAK